MVRGVIQDRNNKSRKHIVHSTMNKAITSPIPQNILNDLETTLNGMKDSQTLQEKYNFLEKELININKSSAKNEVKNKLGEETLKLMKERKEMLYKRKDNKQNIANIRERRYHYNKRLSIAKVATDFYKNLYTETDRTTPEEEEKVKIPCILESEVTQAIKSQKSGKAPGDDKISNELLKQSLPAITKYVTLLFNEIIETEQIPIQWTKSTIILLHKKGDKNEINNYRPISLKSNIYKVFSKITLRRISKHLEENQPREQAGFPMIILPSTIFLL
ncbi:unnamed protein product [Pieris macdunnoughi]|uniref:Reverse transcriptase domain-containing protein n=1 Tax=Pieris macdunnoughi TaxID=345717 RepID=A0A821TUE9_9NEOP|nr:unnamed protein product [Pieris macdunnoughi]